MSENLNSIAEMRKLNEYVSLYIKQLQAINSPALLDVVSQYRYVTEHLLNFCNSGDNKEQTAALSHLNKAYIDAVSAVTIGIYHECLKVYEKMRRHGLLYLVSAARRKKIDCFINNDTIRKEILNLKDNTRLDDKTLKRIWCITKETALFQQDVNVALDECASKRNVFEHRIKFIIKPMFFGIIFGLLIWLVVVSHF